MRPHRLEEREEKKGKAERKLKECQIDRALVLASALASALHCWFKESFRNSCAVLSSHVEVGGVAHGGCGKQLSSAR